MGVVVRDDAKLLGKIGSKLCCVNAIVKVEKNSALFGVLSDLQ